MHYTATTESIIIASFLNAEFLEPRIERSCDSRAILMVSGTNLAATLMTFEPVLKTFCHYFESDGSLILNYLDVI